MIAPDTITFFCLLILFLPLVAFVINIFFGKRLPRQGDWVSVGAILTTLLLSLILFFSMFANGNSSFSHEVIMPWIDLGPFQIQ